MKDFYQQGKHLLLNNKKVVENYFFMTLLQILNSFFYLLIYPYLIRTLGAENYGLYVFALSIVTYFITVVNFGFDITGLKAVVQNLEDKPMIEKTLSSVFTTKVYLELLSFVLFSVLVLTIPALRENKSLLYICFTQTVASVLLPQWYFQGIQRMRIITVVQLIFKLISLPFIFIFVRKPGDLIFFASITSSTIILGSVIIFLIIRFKDGLVIKWQTFGEVRGWLKDTLPFFLSNSVGSFKEQSIVLLAGVMFGMKEVAVYDLANKIIMVPRILFMSINGALFPKISLQNTVSIVKRVIKLEAILGLLTIVMVVLFGKYVVSLMGGQAMIAAYPLAAILSVTVLVWLVVGAYHFFVFVPRNMYYIITKNQIIALLSMLVYLLVGFIFVKSIYVLAFAIALSGLTEIFYSQWVAYRKKLLKE